MRAALARRGRSPRFLCCSVTRSLASRKPPSRYPLPVTIAASAAECRMPPALARRFAALVAVACVASFASAARAGDDPFVVLPFLQHLSPTRAQLRFQTDEPAAAVVDVTQAGSTTSRKFFAPAAQAMHDVTVDGLAPGTSYSYVVHVGSTATPPAVFTTANEDASKPFDFLVLGDNRDAPDVLGQLVAAMMRAPGDFVVHTGDLVPSGKDEDAWLEFFRTVQPLLATRCAFVAMGNHELAGKGAKRREPFLRYFAPPANPAAAYFTFRWGNTRFFVLDTQESWEADQGPWLRDQLERADNEPGLAHRFVALHHSPFSSGPHGPNKEMRSAGILHSMLEHRVDLILGGHDHMYERSSYGGLKYIISGGGGAPLYDIKQNIQPGSAAKATFHCVQVHVDGDRVSIGARDVSGNVFDAAAYRGTEPWTSASPPPALSGAAASDATAPQSRLPPRKSACGCSTPGATGDLSVSLVLAAAAALAFFRRSAFLAPQPCPTALIRDAIIRYAAHPMRTTIALVACAVALLSPACATYLDDLNRAETHYQASEHERALALFRVLESDLDSLSYADRSRYAYLRGMNDYRLGKPFRADARHWLSFAKAMDREQPDALKAEWKTRLEEALRDLNQDAYGVGVFPEEPAENGSAAKGPATSNRPSDGDRREDPSSSGDQDADRSNPAPKKNRPTNDDSSK